MACTLEIKTLKGKKELLEDISLDSTVGDLYTAVTKIEDTPDGKWKLMLIAKSPRTLKPIQDEAKQLKEYGVVEGRQYRVEVILDMGACHSSCRRN